MTPREGPSREHRLAAAARGDETRKAPAPPRSAGLLTAVDASQRSPLPAARGVRGQEVLLHPTLILLSTPLLSSVWTSRSRSSVSSSVAAAAILFLPDNRPNCASGKTSPADSPPPPWEALTQGGPEDTRRGGPAATLSSGPKGDVARPQPPDASAVRGAWKLRRRIGSAAAAEWRAGSLKRGVALTAELRGRSSLAAPRPARSCKLPFSPSFPPSRSVLPAALKPNER